MVPQLSTMDSVRISFSVSISAFRQPVMKLNSSLAYQDLSPISHGINLRAENALADAGRQSATSHMENDKHLKEASEAKNGRLMKRFGVQYAMPFVLRVRYSSRKPPDDSSS